MAPGFRGRFDQDRTHLSRKSKARVSNAVISRDPRQPVRLEKKNIGLSHFTTC
jgi:hypothetical protein